jgi:hypothetical protein
MSAPCPRPPAPCPVASARRIVALLDEALALADSAALLPVGCRIDHALVLASRTASSVRPTLGDAAP